MHPDRDPKVPGFFASQSEDEAKAEDVGDEDSGVLDVEDGPTK